MCTHPHHQYQWWLAWDENSLSWSHASFCLWTVKDRCQNSLPGEHSECSTIRQHSSSLVSRSQTLTGSVRLSSRCYYVHHACRDHCRICRILFKAHPHFTHRVIGKQSSVLVEHKPSVLPSVHHVRPFGQRALHNTLRCGRHFQQITRSRDKLNVIKRNHCRIWRAELYNMILW